MYVIMQLLDDLKEINRAGREKNDVFHTFYFFNSIAVVYNMCCQLTDTPEQRV